MRVLATGTEGYIGTVLGSYLIDHGFDVVGLDSGFYKSGWLYTPRNCQHPATIVKDTREIEVDDLCEYDAVVHLAELSNDPLGELNPSLTYRVNHEGTTRLARLCKQAGVKRFVHMSSCSVYGAGSDDWTTEESSVNPQTAYAECKVKVEEDVAKLADDNFSPTFMRNATAFGPSPRMRFDVVLNNLSGLAWSTGAIKMISDGSPWRPLVHVLDICQAIKCCLRADRDVIHNQILNVGSNSQNYRVREIADIVAQTFPGCELSVGNSDGDNRSYRVSFDKIHQVLPDFECQYDAKAGAEQLRTIFEATQMEKEVFQCQAYTRLAQLKYLIRSGQITEDLFWSHTSEVGTVATI